MGTTLWTMRAPSPTQRCGGHLHILPIASLTVACPVHSCPQNRRGRRPGQPSVEAHAGGPSITLRPQLWTTCGRVGRSDSRLWIAGALEVHDDVTARVHRRLVHGSSPDAPTSIDRSSTGHLGADQAGRRFSTESTSVMTTPKEIPLEDSSTHIYPTDPRPVPGRLRPRSPMPDGSRVFATGSPDDSPAAPDSRTVVRADLHDRRAGAADLHPASRVATSTCDRSGPASHELIERRCP
jgi:hypothetical protein